MRRVVVAVLAASLIGAMLASPILAETVHRDTSEQVWVRGQFAFSEGGRDFTGEVLIIRDAETGEAISLFFYASRVRELCDDGGTPGDPEDDFVGEDLIDFTAFEAPPTTLSIAPNLSAASASATSAGQYTVIAGACDGTPVETPLTVSWQMSVEATGPAARTTQTDEFPNEDGTVTTQTIKSAQRGAVGWISIDGGAPLALTDASITQYRIVIRTH